MTYSVRFFIGKEGGRGSNIVCMIEGIVGTSPKLYPSGRHIEDDKDFPFLHLTFTTSLLESVDLFSCWNVL